VDTIRMEEMNWPDIRAAIESGTTTAVVRVGSTEQHGPHLPTMTDARIGGSAAALLLRYPWPGNVRELRNVIERTLILSAGDTITAANLPRDLRDAAPADALGSVGTLAESEAAHIERVVRFANGNLKLAARCLGIARSTLFAKLARLAAGAQGTPRSRAAVGRAHTPRTNRRGATPRSR